MGFHLYLGMSEWQNYFCLLDLGQTLTIFWRRLWPSRPLQLHPQAVNPLRTGTCFATITTQSFHFPYRAPCCYNCSMSEHHFSTSDSLVLVYAKIIYPRGLWLFLWKVGEFVLDLELFFYSWLTGLYFSIKNLNA